MLKNTLLWHFIREFHCIIPWYHVHVFDEIIFCFVQDDQPKQLNYADLSFNNSSSSTKQPPPYSATEYSEMAPQKRGPPGEDKQGEGGGFELWC